MNEEYPEGAVGHERLIRMFRNTRLAYYLRKEPVMVDLSDPAVIEDIFTYHKPEGDQPAKYEAIRNAAKEFAKVLIANTPKCADQSAAIRHLREAVFTANAAVALKGLV